MGCWSKRRAPAPHAGNEGATPSRSTSGGRKAVIRQPWKLETVGSSPTPLTLRAHGPTGRHQFGILEIRVRFPVGPFWKVAGYGWPGRTAKAVLPTEMRVRLPCLPLDAPMVKWTIIPRFERGVPGSNPGRGAWTVPSFSGQDIPVTWERSLVRIQPGLLMVSVV